MFCEFNFEIIFLTLVSLIKLTRIMVDTIWSLSME